MPELPEVEIVRRALEEQVVDKTIESVDIYYLNIIRTPSDVEEFKWLIAGQTIRSIGRKGKYLLLYMDQVTLVSHLRMEGKYIFTEQNQTSFDKHIHLVFRFTDKSLLQYRDVRKFGTMDLLPQGKEQSFMPLKKLGQEPIDPDFDQQRFKNRVQSKTVPIKQILLNQEIVSGLGNIYVDETLALSKIHPLRTGNSLTDQELDQIITAMKQVLEKAIEYGGSTIRSYESFYGKGSMQDHLAVYGRTGQSCLFCGAPIEKIKVGGRGTHYCPVCQRNHFC